MSKKYIQFIFSMDKNQQLPKQDLDNYQQSFQLCYLQNDPQSLTVTFKPQMISKIIKKQIPKFIWLNTKGQSMDQITNDFKTHTGQLLTCLCSIQELIQYIKISPSQQTISVICSLQIAEDVVTQIQLDFNRQKINKLIHFGEGDNEWKQNTNHLIQYKISSVKDESSVIQEITKYKDYYAVQKEFNRFISLSTQIQKSNVLVYTIFAMMNHKTNRKQLCKQFHQLIKITNPNESQNADDIISRMEKRPLDITQAIKLYTSESFVYDILNKILISSKEPASIYIIQPYFCDLLNAIRSLYLQQKKNSNIGQKFQLFRGGIISEKEFEFFSGNIDSVIQNLGFLSTSRNKNIAFNFVKNVLFQIEVSYTEATSELDFGFAFVQKYSIFQQQEEIIFNPLNTFKICSATLAENFYKISLKLIEFDSIIKKPSTSLSEWQKRLKMLMQYQIIQKNRFKNMGKVLHQMFLEGNFSYFKKFLYMALQKGDKMLILTAYYWMGQYHLKRNQKQLAMHYYEMLSKLEPSQNDQKFYNYFLLQITWIHIQNLKYDEALQTISLMSKQYQQDINVLNKLRFIYLQKGDLSKAKHFAIKASQKIKQKIGNKHPHYAISLKSIAKIESLSSNINKAIEYTIEAKNIIKSTIGENSTQNVHFLLNIGTYCLLIHEYNRALQYFTEAKMIMEKKCGQYEQNQILYLSILGQLGNAYLYARKLDKAKQYSEQAFKMYSKKYGKQNIQYADHLQRMGDIYYEQRQFNQALQCFLECQKIYKNKNGENSLQSILILGKIGDTFDLLCQYQKALENYEKRKNLLKNIWGKNILYYPRALKDIGCIYSKFNQLNKALECYLQALEILKRTKGEFNLEYADTLSKIGSIYKKQYSFNQSIKYHTQALKIKSKTVGKDSLYYGDELKCLANCYFYLDQVDKALSLYLQSKQIFIKNLGDRHVNYAILLIDIGDVYKQQNKLQDALKLYFEARDIYYQKLGQNDRNYMILYTQMADAYYKLGYPDKALYYLILAKNNQGKILGQKNQTYANVLVQVGKIYKKLNQYQKALCYLQASQQVYIQLKNLKIRQKRIEQTQQIIEDLVQKIGKEKCFSSHEDTKKTVHLRRAYKRLDLSQQLKQTSSQDIFFTETIDQILNENAVCTNFINL